MLAGFAAHRALEQLGADAFEAYPYLAFAMWKKKGELLPAKSRPRLALAARQTIVARLAREARLRIGVPHTIDQADAAVMAITGRLSARDNRGTLLFHSMHHGRFVVAVSPRDSAAVGLKTVLDRA